MKDEDGINTFPAKERIEFMEKWKRDNHDQLVFELGAKSDNYDFLNGILFATLVSKTTVPQLQNVIQADAAHMNFGKYTQYLAHRNTANANMSPVAFGIIFGNEIALGGLSFGSLSFRLILV